MLPIITSPVEDELLFSYIHRLAKLNLLNIFSMNNMFRFTETVLKYDSSDYLLDFLEEVSPGAELDFFYAHTIFPGLFPFMDRLTQTKVIAQCFYKTPIPHKMYPFRTKSRIASICICPMCYEEEKKNGLLFGSHTAYRSHNMPDVRVCYRHGCILRILPKNTLLDKITDISMLSPVVSSVMDAEAEKRYAVFCHNLLSINLNTCFSEVSGIVFPNPNTEPLHYIGLEKTMRLTHALFQTADVFRDAIFREYGEKCSINGILTSVACPDCGSPVISSSYSRQFGLPCECKSHGMSPEAYALHIAENVIGSDCRTDVTVKRGQLCVKYTDETNGFAVSGPFLRMLRFPEKYPKLAEKYRYRNLIRSIRHGAD